MTEQEHHRGCKMFLFCGKEEREGEKGNFY